MKKQKLINHLEKHEDKLPKFGKTNQNRIELHIQYASFSYDIDFIIDFIYLSEHAFYMPKHIRESEEIILEDFYKTNSGYKWFYEYANETGEAYDLQEYMNYKSKIYNITDLFAECFSSEAQKQFINTLRIMAAHEIIRHDFQNDEKEELLLIDDSVIDMYIAQWKLLTESKHFNMWTDSIEKRHWMDETESLRYKKQRKIREDNSLFLQKTSYGGNI
jgi:hypothetical protein